MQSPPPPSNGHADSMSGGEGCGAMVVEVVFHVSDERHGRAVASQMIDRAHEIANVPECECDLDVNVRWTPSAPLSAKPTLGTQPTLGSTALGSPPLESSPPLE